jgi:MFS transporter, BCD family, chlorophyll transporter
MQLAAELPKLQGLGWVAIVRLGLVQTALGAVVVLTTSTLNRIMVVEFALPALLPGLLVALHYAVQMLRPRLGYGSDTGNRRTPWIVGGMAVLALGGVLAAVATLVMADDLAWGLALGVVAFAMIGLGVGAAGTSLLAMLAKRVAPERRAAAATTVWLMMIAGFAVTAAGTSVFLDPFSPARLVAVASAVSALAFILALAAVWGVEDSSASLHERPQGAAVSPNFRAALAEIWREPVARRFTVFVFVSMLAYSAQDLILEPFAGVVFGFTPGQSTGLAGMQHAGVFVGMLAVALLASGKRRIGSLRAWTIGGCLASCLALFAIAVGGFVGPAFPLRTAVFALGAANGAFAVAAIATMMELAASGRTGREGIRMGLWGAAQAIAFGLGGLAGALASDIARAWLGDEALAYGSVFAAEALLFALSAVLAATLGRKSAERPPALPAFAAGLERG